MDNDVILEEYLKDNSLYDIKLLHRGDYILLCPLTEQSVKWWFRGTLWNWESFFMSKFRHSHEIYPILICIINGEKLLLQADRQHKRITFIHENYQHVDLNYIDKNWDKLRTLMFWLNHINFIPEKYLTKEICFSMLEKQEDIFKKIPDIFKDESLSIKAIEVNIKNYEYVPDFCKSLNFYKNLVKIDGRLLKHVSLDIVDYEICELAVRQNGHALKFVPNQFRTELLSQIALSQDLSNIVFVPEKFLTEEIYIKSLKKNPKLITIIPKKYLTKEICEYAVIKNHNVLHDVPEEWKNEIGFMVERYINGPLRMYSDNFLQTFDEIERLNLKSGGTYE